MLPNPIFLNIHMYGVMLAVGILAGFIILTLYSKKLGFDERFTDFMFFNGIASIAVGIGSAVLFQSVYNYIENPEQGFHLGMDSGMTFIGGLIGGSAFFLIVYFILRPRLTARITDALSMVPCVITIAHAFGRIGCFFAGCCHGKETNFFLGVDFPGDFYGKVHPTQLYEAAFLFALFAVCSYLLLKKKFQHNFSIYLIAYGAFRFCIEFLRGDYRGSLVSGISPSQFWSLCMIALGVAIYFPLERIFAAKKTKAEALSEPATEADGNDFAAQ